MPDIALDLRYLRCAMLVAEYGSFRRAAGALNLSQSTLSRRIQLLESRLGVLLFERARSGTRLTLAGERFIQDASIGATQFREAVNRMTLMRHGVVGELRLGLMASLADGFLAELLGAFHSQFPQVDVTLEEATSQMTVAGILSGRLDVAFIPGEPQLPGCRTEPLWMERIYVAMPTAHRLSEVQSLEWSDVRDEIFLVTADGAGPEIEDHLVRQLSGPGFRPRISVQRIGRENLLNMVARKFGITLTTGSTLGATYPGVRFRPIGSADETVGSSMIWSEANQNPALKKLVEVTRAQRHGLPGQELFRRRRHGRTSGSA